MCMQCVQSTFFENKIQLTWINTVAEFNCQRDVCVGGNVNLLRKLILFFLPHFLSKERNLSVLDIVIEMHSINLIFHFRYFHLRIVIYAYKNYKMMLIVILILFYVKIISIKLINVIPTQFRMFLYVYIYILIYIIFKKHWLMHLN